MKPTTLKSLKEDIKTLSSRITELENSQYKITKAIKSLGRFIPKIRLENTPKIKINF